eukprot:6201632-Pleurochrysis_carterae.AAC.1
MPHWQIILIQVNSLANVPACSHLAGRLSWALVVTCFNTWHLIALPAYECAYLPARCTSAKSPSYRTFSVALITSRALRAPLP